MGIATTNWIGQLGLGGLVFIELGTVGPVRANWRLWLPKDFAGATQRGGLRVEWRTTLPIASHAGDWGSQLSAPAGWYDDGNGRRRWFDGSVWTDRYLDAEQPPPPKPGTAYDPSMDAKAAPNLQPKKPGAGVLWGCLGCVAVPVVVIAIIMGIGAANREPYNANNKYEAIAQCEDRIERLLKAPSTAEFSSNAAGSGTWTVTGTVDSENGFGAMIRSDFQCTVVISGDRATTTVDYLE